MKQLLILAITMIAFSCTTERKLKNHAILYYAQHPGELAHVCAKEYPAKVTVGDTIRITDTTLMPGLVLPCPDREDINGKVIKSFVKCPPSQNIREQVYVHDTLIDVAAVAALAADTATIGWAYRQQTAKLVQTTVEKDKAQKRARSQFIVLVIIAGLGVFFTVKSFLR